MVRRSRVTNRRGKSRLGCLFLLLLVAAVGYYGFEIGGTFLTYFRMRDAMQSEARLAPSIGDDVIRRRLTRKAEELNLPAEARQFRIRRRARPREIVITTSWQADLELPCFVYTVTFRPEARAQL